jgi:hypothetical protein
LGIIGQVFDVGKESVEKLDSKVGVYVMNKRKLTNYIEESLFLNSDSSSANKEILCMYWNLKVHCYVHKSLPLVPVLSQINPVHALPSCLCKMHFNIILPCTPWSSKWSLSLGFPHQSPIWTSLLPLLPQYERPNFTPVQKRKTGYEIEW